MFILPPSSKAAIKRSKISIPKLLLPVVDLNPALISVDIFTKLRSKIRKFKKNK